MNTLNFYSKKIAVCSVLAVTLAAPVYAGTAVENNQEQIG
ncbi:MAG: hypothetical protein CG439_1048 [Methylococcaceae bacterium NSP1-2]|nr:MAG: hypothetical protein CG439_1048 [Methylococcaceae bacterium NSP1-2]